MSKGVQKYIDAVPEGKPLFEQLQKLILTLYPDAEVAISKQIPTYKVKGRMVGLGYWKNGVSLYINGRHRINEIKVADAIPVASLKRTIHHAIEQPEATPITEMQGE